MWSNFGSCAIIQIPVTKGRTLPLFKASKSGLKDWGTTGKLYCGTRESISKDLDAATSVACPNCIYAHKAQSLKHSATLIYTIENLLSRFYFGNFLLQLSRWLLKTGMLYMQYLTYVFKIFVPIWRIHFFNFFISVLFYLFRVSE